MKMSLSLLLICLMLPLRVLSLNINGCILTYAVPPARRLSKKAGQVCLYQFINNPGALDNNCLQLNIKLGKASSYAPPGLSLSLKNKVTMHITKSPLEKLILDEE